MIQTLSDIYLYSDIDGTLGIAGLGIPQRNRQAIAGLWKKEVILPCAPAGALPTSSLLWRACPSMPIR